MPATPPASSPRAKRKGSPWCIRALFTDADEQGREQAQPTWVAAGPACTGQMEEAAQETADPFDGLRLRGMAYVAFALENPEQYRLAMMRMPGHAGMMVSAFSADDIVVPKDFFLTLGDK